MSIERKITGFVTGLHARMYKRFEGAKAGEMKGVPMLVLTTTGRKSGKKRDRPLMKIEHDGATHVIASNNGRDDHPSWLLNLQADPNVHVQDGPRAFDAKAVVLEGAAREAVYEKAKSLMDNFVGYEQKADRTIPVVRLDPR